jgi:hypothetical protein
MNPREMNSASLMIFSKNLWNMQKDVQRHWENLTDLFLKNKIVVKLISFTLFTIKFS